MGVVYKARDKKLGRFVAVKMIRSAAHASQSELARFMSEAEAVARLQHPNVVQVFGVGEHGGLPFISLEYCPGGSLDRKLLGKPLPPGQAAALTRTLAEAIQAAHTAGVVHRDLKPGNVLLDAAGMPKVSDFGLAQQIGEAERTVTGALVGTPSYMSPEQASREKGQTGPASDIYSLGAMLYCCLTGRPPFQSASELETLRQVREEEPAPPRRLNPAVPVELQTICLKCLEKDPGRRYASAAALGEDLRRFANGEPVLAVPVGPLTRTTKWVRRRPVVAGLLTAVAVVASVGIAAFAWAYGEALHEAERARLEARRADGEAHQARLQTARADAEAEKAVRALADAKDLSTQMALERATAVKEPYRRFLWLARALEMAPSDNCDLRRAIRANLAAWTPGMWVKSSLRFPDGRLIDGVAIAPDGATVAATNAQHSEIRFWDLRTGMLDPSILRAPGHCRCIAINAAGNKIAIGSDGGAIHTWDRNSGTWMEVAGRASGDVGVSSIAFGPEGDRILTASSDGTSRLWRTKTGTQVVAPFRHEAGVSYAAFGPDGRVVATACLDTVRFWDAATGTQLANPLKHDATVNVVAFSRDGKLLISGSDDGRVSVWEFASRSLKHQFNHSQPVLAVALAPSGRILLTGSSDHTARLWDVERLGPLGDPWVPYPGEVRGGGFCVDERVLWTKCWMDIRIWECAATQPVLHHPHWVGAVAFSPDSQTLLTGGGVPFGVKHTARLWDARSGKPLCDPIDHKHIVTSVAFSPDGKYFLTGTGHPLGGEGEATLWHSDTRKPALAPIALTGGAIAVAFAPHGRSFAVATCGNSSSAQLYDTASGRLVDTLQHPSRIVFLTYSRDGKSLLTGSSDDIGRVWDLDTKRVVELPHGSTVAGGDFSYDGKVVLTSGGDWKAKQWDRYTGRPVGKVFQHQDWIRSATYSPDGTTILTGSGDGTARQWDVATGMQVGPAMEHNGMVFTAEYSRDGKRIATGGQDGTARLWTVHSPVEDDAERVMLWAKSLTGHELETNAIFSPLDGPSWIKCHERLQELGGAPVR
jgi:WD40 repeat protein/tRNA A-37 threonylcarbamoyl transferase component Bud32